MTGLDELRRYAIARTLFTPTTLPRAIKRLGFVQADPIRAPARAQDLILRHRVKDYRAGDLERRYPRLDIEEDFFVNYGFLPRAHQILMHPRARTAAWTPAKKKRAQAVLEFVQARPAVHPREVDDHFQHGRVKNFFGGSSSASTHLLDEMHYRGLLRVVKRDSGIRVYAAIRHAPGPGDAAGRGRHLDALVDVIVNKYAPLPGASLSNLVGRLRWGAPQWRGELKAALQRARERLAHASVNGVDWYWPATEDPRSVRPTHGDTVRLLAPFDPVVWDRRRFELLWDWPYRFEAYVPAPKRKLGYYALPMLWRDRILGWCNVAVKAGKLTHQPGYVIGHAPQEQNFGLELEAELERMRVFLALLGPASAPRHEKGPVDRA
jgi:uncharacterized protein